ncbi:MAG: O-antigen ligase family protein [Candidatus Omnitrophota bacterium]
MEKQKISNILDRLRGFSFYLLVAAVAFSNSFTEIATTTIIVLWIIRKILDKDLSIPGGRLTLLLLLFTIWNLASFMNSAYIYNSIRGLLKVITQTLLFAATIDHFRGKKNLERFLLFALGFGFLICVNGIIQYTTGMDLIRQRTIDSLDCLHRVSSSFKHSNDFGAYLIVVISVLLSLFFSKSRNIKERILLIILISTAGWSLAATSSRGAWLGFIIAVLFLAMMKSKRLFGIMLLLLVLSPVLLPGSVKSRFMDLLKVDSVGGTVWERKKLWSGTLAMVKQHPILGFGVNTYTKNFPKYKPKDYPDVRYTHNSYLHMAAEIGVVGSSIFLIFLASVIASSLRNMSNFKKGLSRDLSFGLLAGTIGFLAHCGVDTHLYSVTLAAFLFLCLGVIAAFRNLSYDERN